MSHTNAQVAAAFIRQEPAQSLHMRSTGTVLYSYDTPIACHDDNGTIRVSCQQHSITTTRHHSELWQAAYNAGYDGPPSWAGRPEEYRRAEKRGENVPELVPFHQITRIDTKAGPYDRMNPPVCGYSKRDAPAVVWRKLTDQDRAERQERQRAELDALLDRAWKDRAATTG